jgi:ankyrin repeat protein
VQANPERVNDRDEGGFTPLYVAVWFKNSYSLTVWLLDEKGADVNATMSSRCAPLHSAYFFAMLTTLLNRGADPTIRDNSGWTPLMMQMLSGCAEMAARLLQDLRARGSLNVQSRRGGNTALHIVCRPEIEDVTIPIVHVLLQEGANSALTNRHASRRTSTYESLLLRHTQSPFSKKPQTPRRYFSS